MDKDIVLKKPIFFKGVKNTIIGALGIVFGVVPNFISSITEQKVLGLPLNWLLLFSTTIICVLIYTGMYIYRVNKFYKEYIEQYSFISNNRNSLLDDNAILKQNNKYYINKLNKAMNIIDSVENTLDSASKEPNGYEKDLINSLLKNVLLHKDFLKKGDDFVGE